VHQLVNKRLWIFWCLCVLHSF